MISKIRKSQILADRYAFAENEEVLVNALDLCEEMIENEQLKRLVDSLKNDNDILRTRLALRDCERMEYRRIDIKG